MVEDRDNERLTDIGDGADPAGDHEDDDRIGMCIGPGIEVGGYVVDGELGHGAMGVVYSATHPVIGKRAAIKILRPQVSRSPIAVARFIQEARAVNQIGHPNIIDIFAYGALPDGRAYHVMDLLVGESLRRRLRRSVLHPSEAASVIDEIASALMAAHDHGFVHRDLKPDNVFLVTHEGRWPEVKLLDFGLAKLMPEYGAAPFITKTGAMLGTPEYMSPEQARGTGVDHRTDVYALGIVMFEILAGSRPFPPLGDSLATLLQHAEEPPLSLADIVGGLPAEMVQLVDAMLAKTPEARPSLAAVRTVIRRLRTTQLPSRSVAGLALASFAEPPANPPRGITPSHFGARAMIPGGVPILSDHRTLPESIDPGGPGRPGGPGGPGQPGQPSPARISQPLTTTPGVGIDSMRRANPGLPRGGHPAPRAAPPSAHESRPPSPHGLPPTGLPPTGLPPTGLPPTGLPPTGLPHESHRALPGAAPSSGSFHARVDASQPLPPTVLGVGLPPRPSGMMPDVPRRSRWTRFVLAALVIAATAIALALALART